MAENIKIGLELREKEINFIVKTALSSTLDDVKWDKVQQLVCMKYTLITIYDMYKINTS